MKEQQPMSSDKGLQEHLEQLEKTLLDRLTDPRFLSGVREESEEDELDYIQMTGLAVPGTTRAPTMEWEDVADASQSGIVEEEEEGEEQSIRPRQLRTEKRRSSASGEIDEEERIPAFVELPGKGAKGSAPELPEWQTFALQEAEAYLAELEAQIKSRLEEG